MPTTDNITRPITMISHGRSGTSLVMNILDSHPDVTACGETASMLFGTWHAVERTRGIIRPDPELGADADFDARCAKAVRAVFLASFPEGEDATAEWMHKPIVLPWVINALPKRPEYEDKGAWYWRVLHASFPESRNITILRHPYDVILSAADWWGTNHKHTWDMVARMARMISHPDSDIGFAVSHARLVSDPEAETARLLSHVGLSHDPAAFAATGKVYVAKGKKGPVTKDELPERVAQGFSRRADWHRIDTSGFRNEDRDALAAMWSRFGETLEF